MRNRQICSPARRSSRYTLYALAHRLLNGHVMPWTRLRAGATAVRVIAGRRLQAHAQLLVARPAMSQNGYTFSQAQPYDSTVAQPVPESLRSGLDDPCSSAEIVLPASILPILQTGPFIRLKGLKQLGVCSYVRFCSDSDCASAYPPRGLIWRAPQLPSPRNACAPAATMVHRDVSGSLLHFVGTVANGDAAPQILTSSFLRRGLARPIYVSYAVGSMSRPLRS